MHEKIINNIFIGKIYCAVSRADKSVAFQLKLNFAAFEIKFEWIFHGYKWKRLSRVQLSSAYVRLNRLNLQALTLCSHDIILWGQIKKENPPEDASLSFTCSSLSFCYYRVQHPLALAIFIKHPTTTQRLHNSLNPFSSSTERASVGQKSILKNDPRPLHVVGCNLFCLFM